MSDASTQTEHPLDLIVRRVIGIDPQAYPPDASLLSFGADSLSLLVVSNEITKTFAVAVSLRDLLGDLGVLSQLKAHLDQRAAPSAGQPRAAITTEPGPRSSALPPVTPIPSAAPSIAGADSVMPGPSRPGAIQLDETQTASLAGLIGRVTARTRRSKERTGQYRSALADNRDGAGFRFPWKELCYPILSERADGARVRDIDGNEYVDIGMGFGALLFGHNPEFLTRALAEEVGRGVQLGWQSRYAGEAAHLLTELTGTERVTFCNSGTEAVMSALRLARAVTGREKIAMCAGSYHGSSDGVLLSAPRDRASLEAMPVVSGVPASCAGDAFVLPFGDIDALERLRPHGHQLAAIIVEPLPSRRPATVARPYLIALRRFADATGAALIFDEVITGFRTHPGGCQAYFNVRADLVTYGKALGGGMPVGAVAGRARFMDAVDGGSWEFGDSSYPSAPTTWVAGTFFKHPLTMPCVRAVLQHLRAAGPTLQEGLTARTQQFADRLTEAFSREALPVRVKSFGSLFRFSPEVASAHWDLFFYYLLDHGVYVTETRMCYLSTAHSDADLDLLERAVVASASAMRRDGLLAPAQMDASAAVATAPEPCSAGTAQPTIAATKLVPLTPGQEGLLSLCRLDATISTAYHEGLVLQFDGEVDLEALRAAFEHVVERHDALRATFDPSCAFQVIEPAARVDARYFDLTSLSALELEPRLPELFRAAIQEPMDLERGPLVRLHTFRTRGASYACLIIHHLVVDGWSMGVIFGELSAIYDAMRAGRPWQRPPASQFSEYAERVTQRLGSASADDAHTFWSRELQGLPLDAALPTDHPRPHLQTFAGAWASVTVPSETVQRVRAIGAAHSTTLYTVLFAGFALLLHRLSGSPDLIIGTHAAAQAVQGDGAPVGFCVNMLPFRSRIAGAQSFGDFVKRTGDGLLAGYQHQEFSLRRLIKSLGIVRNPGRPSLISVVCNLDTPSAPLTLNGTAVKVLSLPVISARFEVLWNMVLAPNGLRVSSTYNAGLFEPQTMRRWLDEYADIIGSVASRPDISLDEVLDRTSYAGAGETREVAL